MITLEEYKEKLPKDRNLTEEQIVKLKDLQEKLADVFFTMWVTEINKKKPD